MERRVGKVTGSPVTGPYRRRRAAIRAGHKGSGGGELAGDSAADAAGCPSDEHA